jgi:hypothetical protein
MLCPIFTGSFNSGCGKQGVNTNGRWDKFNTGDPFFVHVR